MNNIVRTRTLLTGAAEREIRPISRMESYVGGDSRCELPL